VHAIGFCGLIAGLVHAAPVGPAFTYQGQLKEGGAPVDAPVDFVFRLFDAPINGTQIGADVIRSRVDVVKGLFAVELDFGAGAFNGEARWLAITVAGTPLTSRQPVTAAPYALKVPGVDGHSLDASDGSPTDALFVDASGRVGIGTMTPEKSLEVVGPGIPTVRVTNFTGGLSPILELNNVNVAGPNPILGAIHFAQDGEVRAGLACDADTGFRFFNTGLGGVNISSRGAVGIGTSTPDVRLHITRGTDALTFSGSGYLVLGEVTGRNLVFDERLIQARVNSAPSSLLLNPFGGNVGIGTAAPEAPLHIFKGSAGVVTAHSNSTLVLENSTDNYLSILSTDATESGIIFAQPASFVAGGIFYNNPATPDGLQFRVNGNSTQMVITGGGDVGIGTTNPQGFKLAVNGTAAKTGGGSWSTLSDRRLKKNVEPLDGALSRLLSLRGVTFEFTAEGLETGLAQPGRQVGLIAQEVEPVFPEWVSETPNGHKFVTETGTTALMVEALRELRAEKDGEIASLRERLAKLERQVAELLERGKP
jgi:hypothetical protein